MARRSQRVMPAQAVIEMAVQWFPAFLTSKEKADRLETWYRGQPPTDEGVFRPQGTEKEYDQLAATANTPWASLVVTSLIQTMFVEGVRKGGKGENLRVWEQWERNGWSAKQARIHRASRTHNVAYAMSLPTIDPLTGGRATSMTGYSARKMAAFYDEPDAEWPTMAIWAEPIDEELPVLGAASRYGKGPQAGWNVRVIDETAVHFLTCTGNGGEAKDWSYVGEPLTHPANVTPVVGYMASPDVDGVPTGEVEPFIPLLRRIDQDTFDRLIVQRFGAWKVRYATGLARPDKVEDQRAMALAMRIQDILISDNPDSKFGTLDATEIAGFISARDSDLRDLSATSQTPPHHMLGLSSNLQAESLAAAEAGLQRKSLMHRTQAGEDHEKFLRLNAHLMGYADEAKMYDMQVRWRDMESRSLVQAANALGALATQLKVPVEMLWERIPGWSDYDSTRALELIKSGAADQLIQQLLTLGASGDQQNQPPGAPGTQPDDAGTRQVTGG